MQKMGWFGVVRGALKVIGNVTVPPFDRAHTTSYSTLIVKLCVYLVPFSRYSQLFVESRRF